MRKLLLALILLPTIILADAVIFSGNDVKALKANLNLFDVAKILTTSADPSSSGLDAPIGSIAMETVTGNTYIKTGVSTVDWVKNQVGPVNLASDVSGILPIANGGTGSSTALANSKVIESRSGKIQESLVGIDSSGGLTVPTDITLSGAQFNNIALGHGAAIKASTGIVSGGLLTINADTTKFDVSQTHIQFSDSTINTDAPIVKEVTCPASAANSVTNLATSDISYILLDSACVIHQQTTFPTAAEQRQYAFIGRLSHVSRTSILSTIGTPNFLTNTTSQMYDLFDSIGPFNVSGNIITANGANLSLNKSAGVIFRRGSNYVNSTQDPHKLSLAGLTIAPIFRSTQTTFGSTIYTTIDPANYDVGGTITPIGGGANTSTNQRVYLVATNRLSIVYGQTTYSSLSAAIEGIRTETHVSNPTVTEAGVLISVISCIKGATDLTDTTQCHINNVGKFDTSGVSAGASAVTTLQQAYNNSVTPQITTTTANGSVDIKRGSAADTDYVMKILNGAGSLVTGFKGDGHTTIEGVTSTGATGTGKFVFDTSPTLVTPNLGTPSAATLTNATGLPIATGVSGMATGMSTFLTTPSSANLAATVTDETGSGALVFGTSPSLTTPSLGDATATTINSTSIPTSKVLEVKDTLTTKGDLYVATGASTTVRQAVGADDTELVADSTQTNGIAYRTSKQKGNLLANWSFEKATVDSGWTITGGGTSATSTTNLQDGAASLTRTSTGAWTVVQDVTAFATAKSGQDAEASIWVYSATASADLWLCPRVNGASVTASVANGCVQYTNLGAPQKLTVFMLYGSTSTGLEIKGSGAITYILDDAYLGDRRNSIPGITTTPWTSYTPTLSGFGTTTNTNFKYRRIGSDIQILAYWTNGTVAASLASFTLPSGLSVDVSKISIGNTSVGNGQIVGRYAQNSSGNTGALVTATGTDATKIYFGILNGANNQIPGNGADISVTGGLMSINTISIPIAEWAGDNNAFTTKCDDPRQCETVFSAVVSSTGVVSAQSTGTSFPWLSGNCTVSATSQFDCPVTSGLATLPLNCEPEINFNGFGSADSFYDLANSTNTNIRYRTSNVGSASALSVVLYCHKQGADYTASKLTQQIVQGRTQLTTPGTGAPKFVSGRVSSTGTVSNEKGDPINGNCSISDTSKYTCTFTSGLWSSAPNCGGTAQTDSGIFVGLQTDPTTTTVEFRTRNSANALSANSFEFWCHGE